MRLRHFGLPAATTVLALTVLAAPVSAPAFAEPTFEVPLVGVLVPEQVTVIEGTTKSVTATVLNAGTATAKAVVLQFGSAVHPVDPAVGLKVPAGCGAQGCEVGDLAPGGSRRFTFTLTPGADATALTSTFDVTVGGAEGVLGYQSPVTVVRAKSGLDLELAPIDDLRLGRGQTADVPVAVRNAGTERVDAIGLVMVAEPGLQGLTKYRNCEVDADPDLSMVVCLFEQEFPAGATFSLPSATPLQIKVAPDAGGPYKYSAAVAVVGVPQQALENLSEKSGPTLRMSATPPAGDINEDDNIQTFGVEVGKSTADSAAIGASFRGAVGDSASIQVGVRNEGPTAVIPPSLTWFQTVRVTIPAGVRLTAVDDNCVPGTAFDFATAGTIGGRVYTCFILTYLGPGASHLFTFTAEITDPAAKPGAVVVDGGVQDPDRSNDRAAIGVQSTASGEGGGLPVTGASTGWFAAAGIALLLLGLTLHRLARRRRIVTVAD